METADPAPQRIEIGWVTQPSRPRRARQLHEAVVAAAERLRANLQEQFGMFEWRVETLRRRPIPASHSGADPLSLVETGFAAKISKGWDFAVVATDAELLARERPFTIGVPSSALETVVLTTSRFAGDEAGGLEVRIAVLAQYLFGHVLGLEPHEPGAMRVPRSSGERELERFEADDAALVRRRLARVANLRLEERRPTLNRLVFGVSAALEDPREIWTDVAGYQPWLQPFRLGRLTAAAFVTTLLLFLGAEAWELGIGMHPIVSSGSALLAIAAATVFLYRGQNLTELTRRRALSEQLARSHVVLLLCLTIGMASLWLLLFAASLGICHLIPWAVVDRWLAGQLDLSGILRFSMFTATIGTLAGALGGNLENEDDFKAQFLFDEEV